MRGMTRYATEWMYAGAMVLVALIVIRATLTALVRVGPASTDTLIRTGYGYTGLDPIR